MSYLKNIILHTVFEEYHVARLSCCSSYLKNIVLQVVFEESRIDEYRVENRAAGRIWKYHYANIIVKR